MLWEGIRLYSRSQYESLGADHRFILTREVREKLHPDVPETYIDKSVILVDTKGRTEVEVEGVNFLAVDDPVPDFTIISMRDAERRYPEDLTECRLTGSTLIAKLYQDEQDDLLSGKMTPKVKPRSEKTPRERKRRETEPSECEPVGKTSKANPDRQKGLKRAAVRSDSGVINIWKKK